MTPLLFLNNFFLNSPPLNDRKVIIKIEKISVAKFEEPFKESRLRGSCLRGAVWREPFKGSRLRSWEEPFRRNYSKD